MAKTVAIQSGTNAGDRTKAWREADAAGTANALARPLAPGRSGLATPLNKPTKAVDIYKKGKPMSGKKLKKIAKKLADECSNNGGEISPAQMKDHLERITRRGENKGTRQLPLGSGAPVKDSSSASKQLAKLAKSAQEMAPVERTMSGAAAELERMGNAVTLEALRKFNRGVI